MADTLKVYKGTEVVATAERAEDGTASVTIDGLEAETTYAKGTYQVAFSNESGESAKVDVPEFTTKASAPAEPTNVTTETTDSSADVNAE
ncbi:fibronectin type III domain-containing protein [Staphylococcus gallinarum]|uniref:fibronectin type III domain-containing protein n=1 Tax=Staphylococcus gallinarum TaxID=1293 RepID=UPI0030BAED5D